MSLRNTNLLFRCRINICIHCVDVFIVTRTVTQNCEFLRQRNFEKSKEVEYLVAGI